jgi:adenylate cyclase
MRLAWKEQGKTELNARCGVNTGNMIVGNMGSIKKFNYTVIGANVEFGEHLESGGKTWGTIMSISEHAYRAALDAVETRILEVDRLEEKPVGIFEMIVKKGEEIPENMQKGIAIHEEAIRLYYERKWDEAEAKFNEVFEHIPGDSPSKKGIDRCKKARENPPGEEFDERHEHLKKLIAEFRA